MADLTQQITGTTDETTFNRDGTTNTVKKVTFYLGKFGPFVERFPADSFTASAVQQRIDALKLHLQQLNP